jgi:hypothetical protein
MYTDGVSQASIESLGIMMRGDHGMVGLEP